jgi:hypothetical protein
MPKGLFTNPSLVISTDFRDYVSEIPEDGRGQHLVPSGLPAGEAMRALEARANGVVQSRGVRPTAQYDGDTRPSCPVGDLLWHLRRREAPPLAWVVQYGADGVDPVYGAWAAGASQPREMSAQYRILAVVAWQQVAGGSLNWYARQWLNWATRYALAARVDGIERRIRSLSYGRRDDSISVRVALDRPRLYREISTATFSLLARSGSSVDDALADMIAECKKEVGLAALAAHQQGMCVVPDDLPRLHDLLEHYRIGAR